MVAGDINSGLHAVRYVLGERTPIANLRAAGVANIDLIRLASSGVHCFRQTDRGILDLAISSARLSLGDSGIPPREVDGLLFLTSSFKHPEYRESFGSELIRRLQLINACAHGICLQGCASLILGLRTAQAMIVSRQCRHILVVVADKICETGVPRVMPDAIVHSDGASSCVVSDEPNRYRLEESCILHDCECRDDGSPYALGDPERRAKHSFEVTSRVLRSSRVSIEEIDLVITNNINDHFYVWLRKALGMEASKIHDADLAATGHCLASDILIALAGILAARGSRLPRKVLLFASSQFSYAAMLLTASDSGWVSRSAPNGP
jgi:3-oxoacyl-[acyl-carrier-protein] synthase III